MRVSAKWGLRSAFLACMLVGSAAPVLADPVGLVQRVQNAVYGTEPQATRIPKQRRDGIVDQELIETTQHSAVEIGFIDGTNLTIGSEATVMIDQFVFDETAGTGEAVLTLSGGAFRWVTGLMPPAGVRFETPTATISIRGTNVKIGVRANGDTLLGLDEGEVFIRAKGTGDTATLQTDQSARITPKGIEILDDDISVADAVVDDGWFNAIGNGSDRDRPGSEPGGGNQ
jgi:hypothetical protein